MNSDICVQLRERGEHVAAEFIERLGKRFVDEERKCLILERAYSQQQQVWSDAIARADRYESALREVIMCWNYEQCAELARAALGEKKDG